MTTLDISMLSLFNMFECLSAPIVHYDKNKLFQRILIKCVFLSICAIFAFTCLQVDFLPRSEAASVIWFQMWARQSTWGRPKPLQQLFKGGAEKRERDRKRDAGGLLGGNHEVNERDVFIGITLKRLFDVSANAEHAAKRRLKGFPFRYNYLSLHKKKHPALCFFPLAVVFVWHNPMKGYWAYSIQALIQIFLWC